MRADSTPYRRTVFDAVYAMPADGPQGDMVGVDAIVDAEGDRARLLGDMIRPGSAREVLCAKEHACSLCACVMPAGSVMWTAKRATKKGRKWWTFYVCPFCPTPETPAVTVSAERLARWHEKHAKRGRGRPTVGLTHGERAVVVELRAAGLGELRLAREFRARTGRKVAARTLARFGRA